MTLLRSTLAACIILAPTSLLAQGIKQISNPNYYIQTPVNALTTQKQVKFNPKKSGQLLNDPEVRLEMDIRYLDREIFNPATGKLDKVRLRGYDDAQNSTASDPNAPLVGPTIETRPGQTLRIMLNNKLPPDESCNNHGNNPNHPHCFNGTNLHSHGLWINPAGNSDNVLISIRPGVSFDYEYNIPADHPAGTFWYHPHLHGSTALQVGSGMSGAIIIRGDRLPSPDRTGDIDTLLKDPSGESITDRVLVLQQIPYSCWKTDQETGDKTPIGCDKTPDQRATVENYHHQFGPKSWKNLQRYTSVNGHVMGKFQSATVGKVERWRLIHAGVRDTINFEIRKLRTGAGDIRDLKLSADQSETWIDKHCGTSSIDYGVIAQDGLTMNHVQMRTETTLQPGYRVDALVSFPTPGDYCIIDTDAPAEGSVNQETPSRRLLGIVSATAGQPVTTSIQTHLKDFLVNAAERTMAPNMISAVKADLNNGLGLVNFIPHSDIGEDEVTGHQELVFNINVNATPTRFEINGEPYSPHRIDRDLPLGRVDEWVLTSNFVSHPFHIHVNPFQIIKIIDENGNDVSAIGADDGQDTQYQGLKGVWKDTLMVKNPTLQKETSYTLHIRTRYQRYIGEFVLHCHILDHEDQGMMQNVRISLPDGQGGTAYGHH